ncbi:T9SS type B sorting domain-containing protein [Psychroflexus sp. ALD_RP9]|uniref:T9SS type B sorting domain-containing protein n=1 Tax=Psychroflexus sp. ALD_RP9 TaxID=2777186 RepID=UPI001A8CC083|nr:T9SS type B sorting domain-containing protein [Psychroflexus sp. ALD_RP9]QSS96976.1 T9SS type B sorting domain-containing protein [Psychroflexus sp. ALD_RP9]
MKRVVIYVCLIISCFTYAQSPNCSSPEPFCAGDSSLVFSNTTGNNGFGAVDCLSSTPNPAWFYIQIDEPGNLNFEIIQSSGGFDDNGNPIGALLDVDFALWGPYENLDVCEVNTPPTNDIIACSYSPSATEFASISNAQTGEYYIMLITNFEGVPGSILLNQNSGSGATDCSILNVIEACENEVVNLDATTNEAVNYVWEFNNGNSTIELENSNTPVLEVNQEGVYTVTPQDNLGNDLTTQEFNLVYTPYIQINEPSALVECETEPELGLAEFNLQEANQSIFSINDEASFSYYLTEEAAINENAEELISSTFTNTQAYNQTIYVRVKTSSTCASVIALDLKVTSTPNIQSEDDTLIYCQEDFPETIQLDAGIPLDEQEDYSFSWSNGEITPVIAINQAGIYTVTVTNNLSGCSSSKSQEVIESNIASFSFEIEDTTQENNSISIILAAESLGNYEYALDYAFDFQDEPLFENLAPGIYDVFVRDKNGCGTQKDSVAILGVKDFFTPNNDGINDFWQLEGIVKADIRIDYIQVFNRYGKHITSFSQNSKGWDGTYKGKPMPANDYWYVIQLQSGQILKGNFTLKR